MESETGKRLFKRLREVRDEIGLSQEKFAELIGLRYKYYQLLEQGRKADPKLSTLERVAGGLGVETWELLNPDISIAVLAEPRARYLAKRTKRPPKK